MSSITDFIAELFRMGNEVARTGAAERSTLLEQALTNMKDRELPLMAACLLRDLRRALDEKVEIVVRGSIISKNAEWLVC